MQRLWRLLQMDIDYIDYLIIWSIDYIDYIDPIDYFDSIDFFDSIDQIDEISFDQNKYIDCSLRIEYGLQSLESIWSKNQTENQSDNIDFAEKINTKW